MLDRHLKLICVVGARPNFIKIAPIVRALRGTPITPVLVHTGQHYDPELSETFFRQLGIPDPDRYLQVGSGTHAGQTAKIMQSFEPVIAGERPDGVLVVGDVNSTLACALVAAKMGISVIHVEAGLRSSDRTMPEEINRVLTDQISDVLYVSEPSGLNNLLREGIPPEAVVHVGNVMVDTLLRNLPNAVPIASILRANGLDPARIRERNFAVATLHRPSNVDDKLPLGRILGALRELSLKLPVFFPIHPRTRTKIDQFGFSTLLESAGIWPLPPLGYLEMLGLLSSARLVLTDSGGIQEETTALGVPCLTLRENTERPVTVEEGTNSIVGSDQTLIRLQIEEILTKGGKQGRVPKFWDGHAAERIASDLVGRFTEGRVRRSGGARTH